VRYPVLSEEGVAIARAALSEGKDMPDLRGYLVWKGRGLNVDEQDLTQMAIQIRGVVQKTKSSEEIDRRCFHLVHELIQQADDPLMIADLDFWTYLAVVHLHDVIRMRFPGKRGMPNLENWGIPRSTECWVYKLWVRGEVGWDPDLEDPYERGRLGSVDFWTSHVHRQQFMNARTIFRRILAFQYPPALKGAPLLWEGEEKPEKKGVPGLRTWIKRLCENYATVEYLLLNEQEADRLIRQHTQGLHRAYDKAPLTRS
jgi:hypothetical protein